VELCSAVVADVCQEHIRGAPGSSQPPGAAHWSTLRNAPVVFALLKALRRRGAEEAWAKVVLPHLPALIRSKDASVRAAVASVYEHVVGPKLLTGL
jgi:hypothetical protein